MPYHSIVGIIAYYSTPFHWLYNYLLLPEKKSMIIIDGSYFLIGEFLHVCINYCRTEYIIINGCLSLSVIYLYICIGETSIGDGDNEFVIN